MPDRKNQSGIRMWSFSDMSLSAASKIGDIANIALLISLVAGVIATFVIVKTSDVKEHHWDALRDQARISIADANARALEAGQKAEEEKLERVKIEQEMLKQLRPRGFTKEQFDAFVSTIKGKIKELTVYTLTDDEASRFGFTIMEALQKADVKLYLAPPTVPTGLSMVRGIPTTGVILYIPQVGDDPEKRKLVETFLDAARNGEIPDALVISPETPIPGVPVPSLFVAKQQRPFTWIPEWLAPSGLARPPWEPK